jgi:hypothetical protein
MEKNVEPEQRAFSPMARWILAIFSLLFGLIMLLWASGSDNDFRYLHLHFVSQFSVQVYFQNLSRFGAVGLSLSWS